MWGFAGCSIRIFCGLRVTGWNSAVGAWERMAEPCLKNWELQLSRGHWTKLDFPTKALMNVSCSRGTRHCSQGIWEESTHPIIGEGGRGGTWKGGASKLYKEIEPLLFQKNPQMLGRSMEESLIGTKIINMWAWATIYLPCPSNSSEIHLLKGRTGFCSGGLSFLSWPG